MPPIVPTDDESDGSAPDQVPARATKRSPVPESDVNIEPDEPNEPKSDGAEEEEEDEDGEGEFAVEKILDHKTFKGKIVYKIKWMGYDAEEDITWEPVENLAGAMDALKLYHASIGGDPQLSAKGAKKSAKKGEKKRSVAETDLGSHTPDNGTPARKRGRKSKFNGNSTLELPLGSWEDDIQQVAAIVQVQEPVEGNRKASVTTLEGLIQWNDGKKTQHKMGILRQKCPQKLCDYYEQHLLKPKLTDLGQ